MYLALERPWAGGASAEAPEDAGVADDAGVAKAPGKKKGKPRRKKGGGGAVVADPEEQGAAPITLSEADRKMSWKGDAVERPPTSLDMTEGGAEARALDDREINATIDADGGGLLRCIEQALGGAPFTGTVTVKMLVDGAGKATRARVHAPAFMHAAGLSGCIKGAARRMGFPAVGGSTVVTVPFPIEM